MENNEILHMTKYRGLLKLNSSARLKDISNKGKLYWSGSNSYTKIAKMYGTTFDVIRKDVILFNKDSEFFRELYNLSENDIDKLKESLEPKVYERKAMKEVDSKTGYIYYIKVFNRKVILNIGKYQNGVSIQKDKRGDFVEVLGDKYYLKYSSGIL